MDGSAHAPLPTECRVPASGEQTALEPEQYCRHEEKRHRERCRLLDVAGELEEPPEQRRDYLRAGRDEHKRGRSEE